MRDNLHNLADWRVILAGATGETDLSPILRGQVTSRNGTSRPRLISLSLTDKRAGEADELTIVIDDGDGKMALPREGALLKVQMGWARGSGVRVGLVDKGSFKVDEVTHDGPPDIITVRARSADFTSDIKIRAERSWHETTLGAIVRDVADRNSLQARIAAALAPITVKTAIQSRESDMAFLRRLGREYDAVATIKQGALIFAAIGAGATAGGQALPGATIARDQVDRHSYRVEKREDAEGATASWHDTTSGKKKDVTVGEKKGARRLSRVYASEDKARQAATSERSRLGRQPVKLDLDLALGRAELIPEQRVTATGFKPEIDGRSWLIAEVQHSLDGTGGFKTKLQLELA